MITIEEKIAVPAKMDEVWDIISEPERVVSCIKGAQLGDRHEDGSFDSSLAVRFSALTVKFNSRVTLETNALEHTGTLSARGRDRQGGAKFNGTVNFAVAPQAAQPNCTDVGLSARIQITGSMASLIESGATAVVNRMTREFTEALVRACTGGEEVAVAGPPAVGSSPRPSRLTVLRMWLGRLFRRTGNRDAPA